VKRWLVVLVACGGSAKAPVVQPVVVAAKKAMPVAALPPAPAGSQMVGHPQTREKIEAPHGGSISLIAETSDGTAAVTADDLGGMRLWTALDGTREPLVVDVAMPHDLAIARHPDGFFVATLDSANNLSLFVLDDRGRTLRHAAISSDAGFVGIEMTDVGVLAWARDQTVALYDLEGVQVARLGTEPGQRIVNIAANGTKAIAVVDADDGTKTLVHELSLPKLAWGPALDVGGDVLAPIAITRSGKRIALETATQLRVLEAGKPIFTQPVQNAVEIGFGDENRLALGIGNGVTWLDLAQKAEPAPIGSQATQKALFATGDGMAMTALGGELMVAKPNDPQYLGYAIESPQVATSGPSGNLVVGVGSDFAQLDSSLAMIANAPTPKSPPTTSISELQWIGGADYIASVASPNGTNDVMVLSSDGRDAQSLDPPKATSRTVRPVRYEPSTHLITISFGDVPAIERWNPDKRRAEKIAAIPHGTVFQQRELVPVAPTLSHGAEIVEVALDEKTKVSWTDATTKKVIAAMPITSFVTADAAGHVYAWMVDPTVQQLVLNVLDSGSGSGTGKTLGTLPHDGTVTLWPDPKGTRVLEIGTAGAALYRIDGTLVWKLALVGASEAVWSGDDAIAIVTASGIARVEAATGNVTAARCGWRFGLSPQAHPQPVRIEPVCTQLRR
jgi:hypothetical protein